MKTHNSITCRYHLNKWVSYHITRYPSRKVVVESTIMARSKINNTTLNMKIYLSIKPSLYNTHAPFIQERNGSYNAIQHTDSNMKVKILYDILYDIPFQIYYLHLFYIIHISAILFLAISNSAIYIIRSSAFSHFYWVSASTSIPIWVTHGMLVGQCICMVNPVAMANSR